MARTPARKKRRAQAAGERATARPRTVRAASGKSAKKTKAGSKPVRMIPAGRIAAAVETLAAPSGTARFAAGKALCLTAEKDPAPVYPHFDAIAALLASESKIVRWNAMHILASLAPADTRRKLDAHLDAYLAFIRGGNLITAANAVGGACRIARHRPDLLERILPAVLEVEGLDLETPECRNVAIGKTLEALADLGPEILLRPEVAAFIRRQVNNPRPSVARRAGKMAITIVFSGSTAAQAS